jgi:hypothetical protein
VTLADFPTSFLFLIIRWLEGSSEMAKRPGLSKRGWGAGCG